MNTPFFLRKGSIWAVPITHYSMEMAAEVHRAFHDISPDCVAVELPETMQNQMVQAASRLPDIGIIHAVSKNGSIYYMAEPCDAAFEALRCALEKGIPAHCIDLDVDHYPVIQESLPDPYAIQRIGLATYYELYSKTTPPKIKLDEKREFYIAKRLKELSLSYDRVLFVGGMAHIESIFEKIDNTTFPLLTHAKKETVTLCTLKEESCADLMAEFGWISKHYEEFRAKYAQRLTNKNLPTSLFPPDRQKLILQLYKDAALPYEKNTGVPFPGYHLRNIMKYVRNYAFLYNRLMPDLYQILTAAKGCVEHNYAYEVWLLATEYPYRKNIDNLPELDLSIEEVWGNSKIIKFHLREPSRKAFNFKPRKEKKAFHFDPPGPFSICSYPPEDVVVEQFGTFLQKKGVQLFSEEGAKVVPFSTTLEDGLDMRETIRHWMEKKLYVKVRGKPPGGVGSVVVIFDEDSSEEGKPIQQKYTWHTTWIGEHSQESDMAFYATPIGHDVIGPGISRCEYGGFMMSYPPRRLFDVWRDPDYSQCRTKSEVLLTAAVDYALKPVIVYVAAKPPRTQIKSFAKRFGKKVVYLPIGQLSPIMLRKIRAFHVLDGHDKRKIADEYIPN